MPNPIKPLYVSATKQDTGKTTVMLGLIQILRDQGLDVGYIKPVGQRYVVFDGMNVDEDAVLARQAFGLKDHPADMSPIAIERGFTEQYIFHRDAPPLERRILDAYGRIRDAHGIVAIEGTGHAGVGSCFDLSNARVAELLGASAVIIAEGGIGRALDEVALSLHLFRKHGVEVLGVILNKTWPEKREKIARVVAQGLLNMGTRLLGVVPFRAQLGHPRMEQIISEVHGRVLCGEAAFRNPIEHVIVAAMTPINFCRYLAKNTLVVIPGDRIDNLLVAVGLCPGGSRGERSVSGLVLTGGFEPPAPILRLIEDAGVPTVLCQEDTYAVAAAIKGLSFKIEPGDADKIEAAQNLIRESLDVSALMGALGGAA